jgi:hypothetical protein
MIAMLASFARLPSTLMPATPPDELKRTMNASYSSRSAPDRAGR